MGGSACLSVIVFLSGAGRSAGSPANRPVEQLTAGYVSSAACRSCHPGNYASWHASFHRTMTQVGEPRNISANLEGLELSHDGWDYRVERQAGMYQVGRRAHDDVAGNFSTPQKIVLTTGSHHLQIFWMETGAARTLVQFPFAYIVAEKIWAPVIQTFMAPPEFKNLYDEGEWNGACMECHTTAPRARFVGGNRFDSRVGEFGISCEACHGEGAEHIAQNRNPLRRFALHLGTQRDPTIVNPAHLKAFESTLACGQCHSISAYVSREEKIAWSQQGGKFRPGQSDLQQKFILQPNSADHAAQKQAILQRNPHYYGDRFWRDGMVRVTGREMNAVLASPCFKGGEFSCLSCHDMHPQTGDAGLAAWADGYQLTAKAESNAACLQCHSSMAAAVPAHTHHAADSTGSLCYNCHMPHTAFGLLRAIRSHQVSSPSVRETLSNGRPNACNLCHLDQPLAWTADKLATWYGQPQPVLSADDREVATGVRWLLQGDAGLRALTAWSMGWAPAQRAAGRDWLYPYLFTGLNDPYAVVRFVSWKSLQSLPGYADYHFIYTIDGAPLDTTVRTGYQEWWHQHRPPGAVYPPQTGLLSDGHFQQDLFRRLLGQRNQSPMFIVE